MTPSYQCGDFLGGGNFLTSWHYKLFQAYECISCSSRGSLVPWLHGTWFLMVPENGLRNQDLGAGSAYCCFDVLASRPSQLTDKTICAYTNLFVSSYAKIFLYVVFTFILSYSWVYTDVSNPNALSLGSACSSLFPLLMVKVPLNSEKPNSQYLKWIYLLCSNIHAYHFRIVNLFLFSRKQFYQWEYYETNKIHSFPNMFKLAYFPYPLLSVIMSN